MRLHQLARTVGYAIAAATVALFLAGLWTYTFEPTIGLLLKNERTRVRPVGEYSFGKGSRCWKRTVEDIDVCYEYRPEAVIYESCRIGAGVSHLTLSPLRRAGWEEARVGDHVPVCYFSQRPGIAVLHRGPDWIMVFGLGILAPFFFVAAKRLCALERPPRRRINATL